MTAPLARLDVAVAVDAPQELVHASHVLSGLADLRARGLIRGLRVGVVPRLHRGELVLGPDGGWEESRARARKTTFLTIHRPSGPVRVAVDLRDAATVFSADALGATDVCFKRSYLDPEVASASARAATALRPFGLAFLARSPHLGRTLRLGASLHAAAVAESLRPDRLVLDRLRSHLPDARYQWRTFRRAFTTDRVRRPPGPAGRDGTVVFQTRAFADEAGDAAAIHAQRAEVIRALRDRLGPRFRGGFVADAFTRDRFPDCLSDIDARPDAYLDALDGAAVVVSTRGLEGAAPAKLSEVLARGTATVSEHVPHRLPAPLVDGVHLRSFTAVAGCVDACADLLADEGGRRALGAAGRAYFATWVDPPVALHRVLVEAMAIADGGGR